MSDLFARNDEESQQAANMPPSTQSCAEMRTDIGSCCGHTARTAANTCSG